MEQAPKIPIESPVTMFVQGNFEPPVRRQISDAQRANLTKAREKAKKARVAKQRDIVPEESKELTPIKEEQKEEPEAQLRPQKSDSDDTLSSESEEEEESPEPSPIKPVRKKKSAKRARMPAPLDEESSEDDVRDVRADNIKIDHAALARATYQRQLDVYKQDLVYKNIFSYL